MSKEGINNIVASPDEYTPEQIFRVLRDTLVDDPDGVFTHGSHNPEGSSCCGIAPAHYQVVHFADSLMDLPKDDRGYPRVPLGEYGDRVAVSIIEDFDKDGNQLPDHFSRPKGRVTMVLCTRPEGVTYGLQQDSLDVVSLEPVNSDFNPERVAKAAVRVLEAIVRMDAVEPVA